MYKKARRSDILTLPTYNPIGLLIYFQDNFGVKNAAAFARLLQIEPPEMSKVLNRKLCFSAPALIRLHEISKLSISELRRLMGDTRPSFR